MNAYHIVTLVPFIIAALFMRENIEEIIRYHIAASNCRFPTCPDVVPGYDGIYVGLIPVAIGILILLFARSKERQRIAVDNDG